MNNQEEPTIGWEKWIDPYGENIAELEWPAEEEEEFLENMYSDLEVCDENEDVDIEEATKNLINHRPMKIITTPQGVIPILEHSLPSRVFKFWVGHTNFVITKSVYELIETTPGVETFDLLSSYRFRIGVGKAFRSHEVKAAVNEYTKEFFRALSRTVFVKPRIETILPNRKILPVSR